MSDKAYKADRAYRSVCTSASSARQQAEEWFAAALPRSAEGPGVSEPDGVVLPATIEGARERLRAAEERFRTAAYAHLTGRRSVSLVGDAHAELMLAREEMARLVGE